MLPSQSFPKTPILYHAGCLLTRGCPSRQRFRVKCCLFCFLAREERVFLMIHDTLCSVSPAGLPRHFDDPDVRQSILLAQRALPDPGGGRHMLYSCPLCHRPWYQAGASEYPCLTPVQLSALLSELHIDARSLPSLPRALCPVCSVSILSGMFSLQEYPHKWGFQFSWESIGSPILLSVSFCAAKYGGNRIKPDILSSPPEEVRSILAWFEHSRPVRLRSFPPTVCQEYARSLFARKRGRYPWKGWTWRDMCWQLGGLMTLSLLVSTYPDDPSSFVDFLTGSQLLARFCRKCLFNDQK